MTENINLTDFSRPSPTYPQFLRYLTGGQKKIND